MPIKRPSDTPQKPRKRPRVPKFNEGGNEEDEPVRQEHDEEDEDIQAEYQEEGGYMVDDIYIPPQMKLSERPTRGERLIIEKIECENFKSYGGVKVMGPFHKSFSAIVGPNGNGKSNIIDAMLFVFGYRAKKIRCKKVSVLIHKSELLPQVSSCAVTVHFIKIIDNGDDDPKDEINIVPDSRITVCRRAYHNNSSSYWLNDKKVVFKEVATFLQRSGIDIVHNRFLILQGEVEQIAQMPPKATNNHETGFLEFIDEIIGTKRYESPLQKLKERMETLDFQREEKSQRVTLAQQHKHSLVEPMKKATAFLRDRNIKIRTNHALNQVKAYIYRQQGVEKSEKLKELEETKTGIQTRLDEINKFNEERRHEYAEAEKAYKVAEANYKKNKKLMDEADAKYVILNREIKTSNEERKKKLKEIEKSAEELEKLQGLPERHGVEIGKLEKRKADLIEEIQSEENATKGDVDKLLKQVDQCVTEKKKADAKFRELKAIVDEKKAARDTLQKELDRSKSNEESEKSKLVKLNEELEELQKTVKRKSGEGLNVDLDQIRKKEAEAKKNRNEAAGFATVEQEKRAAYQNLRSKYAEARDAMNGGMNTNQIDAVMFAAKNEGKFPGLYGRLKDLATIEEKYNIGATAATGMAEFWVVDSDQTGAECIQFLKDQHLASQSFLCVNKMGYLVNACNKPFRTPAESLRIFDLLKFTHPELAPVFYKAFNDTLISENMDIASKVAYGSATRHRVVTCHGEIIETTGSLLGGGNKITQGKFNSARAKALGAGMSKKQIEALKAQCEAAERELQDVMDRRQTFEESANAIETEIAEMKRKHVNYQSDLEASRRMIPLKVDLIKQQEQKIKTITLSPRVLQEKQAKIEEVDAELEQVKEPYDEADEIAKALAKKLSSLQEDKKKEILKKLTKLKEQHKRVDEELNKLKVELRNCEKNKTKIEIKSTKLKSDVEALQEKMLAMVEEKKILEAKALELKEEEAQLKNDKDEKEQLFTEKKSRANEFDQEEKKLKKQKVTLDNNYQTLHDEVRRIEREQKNLISSLDKFELDQIPEVEVEPLEILTEEQLEQVNPKELEAKLHKYTQKLQREEPNLNIIEDYNAAVSF
ncbi:unnamed protein product [Orchesella dallaii]|uniref:SMC hinge domain-containing protein n=1 Tax=Orchesella dallaii TaxID=48710 RepID=A0ABP1RM48_9HEXA